MHVQLNYLRGGNPTKSVWHMVFKTTGLNGPCYLSECKVTDHRKFLANCCKLPLMQAIIQF